MKHLPEKQQRSWDFSYTRDLIAFDDHEACDSSPFIFFYCYSSLKSRFGSLLFVRKKNTIFGDWIVWMGCLIYFKQSNRTKRCKNFGYDLRLRWYIFDAYQVSLRVTKHSFICHQQDCSFVLLIMIKSFMECNVKWLTDWLSLTLHPLKTDFVRRSRM